MKPGPSGIGLATPGRRVNPAILYTSAASAFKDSNNSVAAGCQKDGTAGSCVSWAQQSSVRDAGKIRRDMFRVFLLRSNFLCRVESTVRRQRWNSKKLKPLHTANDERYLTTKVNENLWFRPCLDILSWPATHTDYELEFILSKLSSEERGALLKQRRADRLWTNLDRYKDINALTIKTNQGHFKSLQLQHGLVSFAYIYFQFNSVSVAPRGHIKTLIRSSYYYLLWCRTWRVWLWFVRISVSVWFCPTVADLKRFPMTSGEKKTLECRDINRGSFEWETQKERETEGGWGRERERRRNGGVKSREDWKDLSLSRPSAEIKHNPVCERCWKSHKGSSSCTMGPYTPPHPTPPSPPHLLPHSLPSSPPLSLLRYNSISSCLAFK